MKNLAGFAKGLRTTEAPHDCGFVFLEEAGYSPLAPTQLLVEDKHNRPAG